MLCGVQQTAPTPQGQGYRSVYRPAPATNTYPRRSAASSVTLGSRILRPLRCPKFPPRPRPSVSATVSWHGSSTTSPSVTETVLRLVAQHRFLTTNQVQHFCFVDHQTEATGARVTRRVLARLERDGLLRMLDRRVGGYRAGSAATIWQLAPAGQRVVYGDENRKRLGATSERFLDHCLAIADVHVLLEQHRRIEAIEHVAVEVEPASWRSYQGPSGERRWLQPDLYAEITTADFIDRLFIEVDLGTESLPTLIRKCQQYEDYRRSGIEQTRRSGFPLVLWLFTTEERARKLAQAVRRSSKLTDAMYRYATPETLTHVLAGGAA